MWAVAATLERGRPVLNDWGMDLHDLGYGRRMVSELFKQYEILGETSDGHVIKCWLFSQA